MDASNRFRRVFQNVSVFGWNGHFDSGDKCSSFETRRLTEEKNPAHAKTTNLIKLNQAKPNFPVRKTPSLELGMMLIFCYVPYGLAEWSKLSGIMALLFAGIVASHYTHQNLSLVTQINLQHTLRTLAFLAETSIFAYIGMAMFSFEHDFEPGFCIGSILLILIARAANIYPLSMLVNKFRVVKINKRMQFVMWFSGLRGAIAYK